MTRRQKRRQWDAGSHLFWSIFTVFALVLVAWVVWFVAVQQP